MPRSSPGSESNRVHPGSTEQILSAVELELTSQRAQRRSTQGARTVFRLLGLLLLLGLLAAGLGAMWYLQTVAMQQRPVRPAAPAVTGRVP